MSRLTNAILDGAYSRASKHPMLDLAHGGQNGWAPNLTEIISSQAYVSRPLILIMVEPPKMFTLLPESEKWIAALRALFELHPQVVDGYAAGLTVETEEHNLGGSEEKFQEPVRTVRERSKPKLQLVEKYGRPIQTLLDFWIRYGLGDPEAGYALLGTLGKTEVKDLLADWYSATILAIEPDPLHKYVDKAWLTTNVYPLGTGEIIAKRELTANRELLTLDIELAGVSQVGAGINDMAQQILNAINIQNADPYMRPAFVNKVSADVEAAGGVGYKAWAEEIGRTAVSNMGR